ncbi:hypothetical protein G3A_16240 [Bacillus sp. 17376]|nr:hypothetical protein [Mesobacillus boroniphilus]ESU31579.1 hypothetical protein G3A_16240 [Bacillus sp. 17376]
MNQDLLKFLEDLNEEAEVATAEEIEAAQRITLKLFLAILIGNSQLMKKF